MREWREETFLRGSINRLFQLLARILPGGQTIRIMLHRARGVHIGRNVFISEDVILETACPDLITIEDRASIGIRTIIIAHFRELNEGVRIESDVFVGPGVISTTEIPNASNGMSKVGSMMGSCTRSTVE